MLAARLVIAFLVGLVAQGIVYGQDYPAKPIHFIAGSAGGGVDFAARIIAQSMTGDVGQPVIVENRSSAGGTVAALAVMKSAPDGYTLLFYGSPVWLAPFMRDNVEYDPLKDFAPVTLAVSQPNLLIVHPSLPVGSVKELISLAKARPGALNYTSGSTGTSSHLAAELLKARAGIDLVRIGYSGSAPALIALISGEIQVMFVAAGSVEAQIKSGRLRAIAVTSAKPSVLAPGLPTIASAGLPGYEAVAIYGVFAPARTPGALVNRINQQFVHVLQKADIKERFLKAGVEAIGSSQQEFGAAVKGEMTVMGALIKQLRIRGD
jgi:tripartite-type tricarboxylate transporter receptor subunit TctC